ncbi:MAG: hypothetical protein ACK53A_01960 [Gemmatimonadota bacterium]|jgi:hypothetical protein|nr:hypothetical protein [Gemmatimonadota bacterium]
MRRPRALVVPTMLLAVLDAAAVPVAGGQPRDPRSAVATALTTRDEGIRRVALDGASAAALGGIEEAERKLLGAVTGERVSADTAAARLRDQSVEALRMALDGYAAAGAWGDRRLRVIAALYPRNATILGHAADRAMRIGLADSAGRLYLVLARRDPAAVAWHRGRARAAAATGRQAAAAAAWVTVLELEPTDETAFRSLVGLAPEYPLERLLMQVRRLRQRRPKDVTLLDREVEVLQRMGRLDEAQAVARSRAGGAE